MSNITLDSIVSATRASADYAGLSHRDVDGAASRQWSSRPADERYTSLADLHADTIARREQSTEFVTSLADLAVSSAGGLRINGMRASNHAFSQVAQLAGAPVSYLRTLPADLAAQCMTSSLRGAGDSKIMTLGSAGTLRGVTSDSYGRIWDADFVAAIRDVVDAGEGRWKVPSEFRSADTDTYPSIDPTIESTTLYSGDRDTFLFLVDENNPVQAGFTAEGKPDLYYRGFYAWNGECGGVSNGVATFLYRYVCCNRNIWGQRGFQKMVIRHTSGAAGRFTRDLIPALRSFVDGAATGIEHAITESKRAIAARNDLDRARFMEIIGLGPNVSKAILDRIIAEEGHPAESVHDFVQGVTAHARTVANQNERVELEMVGARLMKSFMAG